MLKTLEPDQKQNWKAHVAPLVHAYNCTRHDSTGFTPFYLMFGRTPRLPLDIFLGRLHDYQTTVKSVRDNLEAAYEAATKASRDASRRQARNYDKKVRGPQLQIGDLVLVKNVGLKGKHKLADKWKQDIHVVIEQPNPDIPVFRVRPEGGGGERVLHRNLLLPISLPLLDPKAGQSEVRESVKGHRFTCNELESEVEEHSDSESEIAVYEYVDSSVPDTNVPCVSVADGSSVSWSPPGQVADTSSAESPGIARRTFRSTGASPASYTRESVESTGASPALLTQDSVGSVVFEGGPGSEDQAVSPQGLAEQGWSPPGPMDGQEHRQSPQDEGEQGHSCPTGGQTGEVPLRRSTREGKRPTYLQDYVSCGQTAQLDTWQVDSWQFRVHVLLQLMSLFPFQQGEIMNSILYVITHFS
jgi:hypothetical protein